MVALCAPYLDAVKALNPDGQLRFYPGSPLLIARGLAIAAAYVENESGATLARPELFRLLKDCRPGDVLLI